MQVLTVGNSNELGKDIWFVMRRKDVFMYVFIFLLSLLKVMFVEEIVDERGN